MKRNSSLLALLLALVAWTCGAPALAQDLSGDRVRAALERTDLRIELATSLVNGASNAEAGVELNAAVSTQSQARDLLTQALAAGADLQLRLLRQAYDLTLRAREHADRAVSLIQGLPDPDRVMAQLQRTGDLIERANDRITECTNDRARALLKVGTEMQTRAENAATESRYLAALQLTMSARERVLRAARLCNQEERLDEASDRALRRTDEVIARAKDALGAQAEERARELLARADRVETEAWAQFKASQLDASLRLTLSARNLAQRALKIERR